MTIFKRRISRQWIIAGIVTCLVLLSLPVAAWAQRGGPANQVDRTQADYVLQNGKITIITDGVDDPTVQYVDSIAIRDGKVVAYGGRAFVNRLVNEETTVIDLKGRRVLPGLIDGHIHGIRNGYHCFSQTVRLDLTTARAAALQQYADKAAQLPDDKWIWTTAGGWNVNQLDTPGMFTIAELNAASAANPVYVQASGFSGVQVNQAALTRLGLNPGDPGVETVNGQATGRLTAPANGVANANVLEQLNSHSIEYQADCLADFVATSNRLGLTAWKDADGNTAPWGGPGEVSQGLHGHQPVIHLRRSGELDMRIAYHMASNYAGLAQALSDTRNAQGFIGDDVLRYMGTGEDNDVITNDDYPVFTRYAAANRLGVEHHVGNHDRNLSGFEAANEVYPIADLNWSIAHPSSDTPTDTQLARAKALGIGYTLTFADVRNGANGPRYRTTMEQGLRMCLASDAMNVANWAPFLRLWYVITGDTLLPGVEGVPAEQRLTRYEALKYQTVECGWFMDQEGEVGSLELGTYGDLIVLSDVYFTVAESKIKDIHSVLTLVDNRIVYAEGEYASLQE